MTLLSGYAADPLQETKTILSITTLSLLYHYSTTTLPLLYPIYHYLVGFFLFIPLRLGEVAMYLSRILSAYL